MKLYLNEIKFPGINAIYRSVICWIAFILLLFLSGTYLVHLFPPSWERFVYGISGTIAALITIAAMLKIEKKSFSETGLMWQHKTLFRFFKGVIIGTILMAIIIFILLAFTELEIKKNAAKISFWQIAFYLSVIPLALMEEIAFRSYPFIKLNKTFRLRATQIIVAIAFAGYHIITGWGVQASFLGPGIWAFVFGLAAFWSGGIAVPTGIHVALNILQPLTGMSTGNYSSIWLFKYKEGASEAAIAKTDMVGLTIQLIILICAIALTEYSIQSKSRAK